MLGGESMGKATGRPTKYDTHVKPYLDKIGEWVAAGATIAELAKALSIAESTLYEYQNKYKEFSEALRPPRAAVCCDIKAALHKKAIGFYYEEKKNYQKEDENGVTVYTEITEKYCPPSEKAATILLNNYDEDWHTADTISIKMRQQEQNLQRRIAEANNFDLDFDGGE